MKTKKPKETVKLTRYTSLGTPVLRDFPINSGAVQRAAMKARGRVIHSGGTRIGSFKDF